MDEHHADADVWSPRQDHEDAAAPWTHAHLPFAGEEAAEGRVTSESPPGMASVPALDGDCCLVHLLNEPSQKRDKK